MRWWSPRCAARSSATPRPADSLAPIPNAVRAASARGYASIVGPNLTTTSPLVWASLPLSVGRASAVMRGIKRETAARFSGRAGLPFSLDDLIMRRLLANGARMPSLSSLQAEPRVRVRREGAPDPDGRCVVYWMQRTQRAFDNPALDAAISLGNVLGRPVVVFFGVMASYPGANARHYRFLAEGVPDIAAGLAARGVGFILRTPPAHSLLAFCQEARPCLVIGDENPLREPEAWRQKVAGQLRVPFWTIDADVIVPSRLFTKEEFAARTLRPKITSQRERFLVASEEPCALVKWEPVPGFASLPPVTESLQDVCTSRAVQPVRGFSGGTRAGLRVLERFLQSRLRGYSTERNKPERIHTSQLSPYLHFGHLGPRHIARSVLQSDVPQADKDALIEELLVRRELAINFVVHNPHYDSAEGFEPWAKKSLAEHATDPRPYRIPWERLEAGESPDLLWNAAQRELLNSGWMHGYVRMYWAKRLLEWTETPAEALALGIYLNDRYQLDGRDPNGYAGLAWAIGGKHDRAWGPVRPIFGMVRYMSFASTSRKFNLKAYQQRVGLG